MIDLEQIPLYRELKATYPEAAAEAKCIVNEAVAKAKRPKPRYDAEDYPL